MSNVTEHDSKEEGEGDYTDNRWVDLLVSGDSVSVSDLLGDCGVLSDSKGSWRLCGLYFCERRSWYYFTKLDAELGC